MIINKDSLTPKQQLFVTAYLSDPGLNATRAYMSAYPKCSAKSAESKASRMVRYGKVRAKIEEGLKKRAEKASVQEELNIEFFAKELKKSLTVNGKILNEGTDKEVIGNANAHNKAVEMLGRMHSQFTDNTNIRVDSDAVVLAIIDGRKAG